MDECNDGDFDFPILRKKSENEKVLRVTSLQPSATQRVKQPLARNISSPTRFNYSMKVKLDNNRISDSSFGSKMSFRGFIRRMSTKDRRRRPDSDCMRERRRGVILGSGGGNKALSIRLVLFHACDDVTSLLAGFTKQSLSPCRSINEEEAVNNSLEERDENDERVTSYISKCSEETDDDTSVSECLIQFSSDEIIEFFSFPYLKW